MRRKDRKKNSQPVSLPLLLVAFATLASQSRAAEPATARSALTHPGYRLLLDKAYVPAAWTQKTFDNLWRVWPPKLRRRAEQASPAERRQMAFARYGLTSRPGDKSEKPLQFVVDEKGNWSANCFTCHGGKMAGQIWPGLPNSLYALQTLSEEIVLTKPLVGERVTRVDLAQLLVPLGSTNGTTNAVVFGIALGVRRDAKLNVLRSPPATKLVHHDMDAPPWWHFKKRKNLYIDGFAKKSHRALMQFALDPVNGPEKFAAWESDFRKIADWMSSIDPPKYPFAIDRKLAEQGRAVFESHCAKCHGRYGDKPSYPERHVSIKSVGTDRVRFDAITDPYRQSYERSWFAFNGDHHVKPPVGYVAPPLDGIWASAPYFHNGSVPTLHDVLHPSARPAIWQRSDEGYDQTKVGLEYKSHQSIPVTDDRREQRSYFDTRKFGKGNGGHDYPARLSAPEKRAVLEYLKTL